MTRIVFILLGEVLSRGPGVISNSRTPRVWAGLLIAQYLQHLFQIADRLRVGGLVHPVELLVRVERQIVELPVTSIVLRIHVIVGAHLAETEHHPGGFERP